MQVRLVDVRTHQPLSINFKVLDLVTRLAMKITTPDIETASELVQDIANHFKIWELQTKASFPCLQSELEKINEDIEQSNTLKIHFAANMSENINNLKASIVRAEASHMIDDTEGVRREYAGVM